MLSVKLITDPLDLGSCREIACTGVPLLDVLRTEFPVWPETARLYRDSVCIENDVTPQTAAEADALAETVDGQYWVIHYPGDPVTAIITVIVTVVLAVALYLFMPKLPTGSTEQESANNTLGQRTNKPRPNGRIPDIFGSVISIPELLAVPLLTFQDNLELEECLMCVGRGSYDLEDFKDGDTPLGLIAGAGVAAYGPFTSPNSGTPQLVIGAETFDQILNVTKANEVNGQQLDAPNANSVSGAGDIRFVAPNAIQNNSGIDFSDFFGPGDALTVTSASFGGSVQDLDATTQTCRFYPDKRIEFQTFDPSTLYSAGQTLIISNAGFAGVDSGGNVVYVDVSGSYVIESVSSTEIQLVD